MLVTPERFAAGLDFSRYVDTAQKNVELWKAVYRTSTLDPDVVARARALPGRWNLFALSEDWCGDAVNALPLIARLSEAVPSITLRIVGRDANPDLMDAHLSGTSRSIPVVMVLDEQFVEHGWWGPRPSVLQRWFLDEGHLVPKEERYKEMRRWYARDRGRSIVDEVVRIMERGAGHLAVGTGSTSDLP